MNLKSTTYRQLADVKVKIKKIERMALINLDNVLSKNMINLLTIEKNSIKIASN